MPVSFRNQDIHNSDEKLSERSTGGQIENGKSNLFPMILISSLALIVVASLVWITPSLATVGQSYNGLYNISQISENISKDATLKGISPAAVVNELWIESGENQEELFSKLGVKKIPSYQIDYKDRGSLPATVEVKETSGKWAYCLSLPIIKEEKPSLFNGPCSDSLLRS